MAYTRYCALVVTGRLGDLHQSRDLLRIDLYCVEWDDHHQMLLSNKADWQWCVC